MLFKTVGVQIKNATGGHRDHRGGNSHENLQFAETTLMSNVALSLFGDYCRRSGLGMINLVESHKFL